ncbi:MAG: aquaporin family protein [Candidatus Melainabacteria bacterium]|nr:aquaporin family protein [Candidatus Melainabacteria bacterium]
MLLRCLIAEFLGTALLLATVIGSGILLHKIDAGNVAVTVLGISVATGGVLYALIQMLGSLSAHFNPVVTLVNAIQRNLRWSHVLPYIAAQVLGAMSGVILANLMFDGSAVSISTTERHGAGQLLGEFVATFGLIGIILGTSRNKPDALPASVSLYVCGAIMFTSSTCFANPAVTVSRILTSTICGIRPVDVPAYIGIQLLGGLAALLFFTWLFSAKVIQKEVETVRIEPGICEIPKSLKAPDAFVLPAEHNSISSNHSKKRELTGIK